MKTLYLVRHGKAEDHNLSKGDYYRELVQKGLDRSEKIASELSKLVSIDKQSLVISSPASRAIQTAEIFCKQLSYSPNKIQQVESIYEAHFTDILHVINQVEEDYNQLFIFGHNPGLSNLCNYLSHSEIELATSNVAILNLEDGINFSMLSGGSANLVKVLK